MAERNLSIFLFKILPTNILSRLFGHIARIPFPPFIMEMITKWWCIKFKVKTSEFTVPDKGFRTIDMFFTRKLNNGVHKIDKSVKSIVSPVDARVDQFGKINGNAMIQAKGIDFSVESLIPSAISSKFINGEFITLYLSPADYHRIHSPAEGKIYGYFNIPGKLFTVQEYMVNGLKGLFSRNERLISYIKTKNGMIAVCKIGAMNVGRISLSYEDVFTNGWNRKKHEMFYMEDSSPVIKKGDELGTFHLGSTIVLLFQKGMIKFVPLKKGARVRVGEKIASYIK